MIDTVKASGFFIAAAALAFVVGAARPASAQVGDHLKCYRIRDTLVSVKYTANTTGLAVQAGCVVRARAKSLCVSTTKTGVVPTPPGGGPSTPGPAGKFLCYRMKCPPHAQIPGQSLNDQFGVRVGTAVVAQMLCTPASPSGAFLDASASAF
jgi:hypothetical protein